MGALGAHIPGEGVRFHVRGGIPLTRIAQARSDLSPAGRGDNGVLSLRCCHFIENAIQLFKPPAARGSLPRA